MPRNRRIQLVGKETAFNVGAWARAVQALARQLQAEWQQNGQKDVPVVPKQEDQA